MKKIIYIDMDDVLCDFTSAHKKGLAENPEIIYPQNQYGYWQKLKPLKNAIETVAYLKENFDVYILSSPSIYNPFCYAEKRVWVEEHLGFDMLEKLILSHNKGLNKGDYLIDDHINGKGQEDFEGELLHFGSDEFSDWDKVKNYFEKSQMTLKVTYSGDDSSATCLICKTKHSNGAPIIPHPNCKCGNLNFDITPSYVRFSINWQYVLVKNDKNWEDEILKQIKKNKKPTYIKEPTEDEKEDSWLLSLMSKHDKNDTVSRKDIMDLLDNEKMRYKKFKGSIEFSKEDNIFFGKILNIKDLILYEGVNVVELEKEFKNAVNDYINTKL